MPGEAKATIRLRPANNDLFIAEKWANDQEKRFDRFVAALQAMAATTS